MMITTWEFIQRKIQWNIRKYCGSKCFVCYFLSTFIWYIYWILFKCMWYMNYDRHECNNSLSHRVHSCDRFPHTEYTAHLYHCIDFELQVGFLVFYLSYSTDWKNISSETPLYMWHFHEGNVLCPPDVFNGYVSYALNIVGTLNIHHRVWVDV